MPTAADLRIIFMGTPEFAVASLDALLAAGMNVVSVITAPDKPAGRGMKLTESAVKMFALEKGLTVLQPEKLKEPAFIDSLRTFKADLQVVVAFRMLPELVWNMPPMGTINVHGSLLPQYRGAAPINWAVINGEKETGVTTFRLQHVIDTGNILMQQGFGIAEDETAGEVHDRMKIIGAKLLVSTIEGLATGTLIEQPQQPIIDHEKTVFDSIAPPNIQPPVLKPAPKIFTETTRIDWLQSVHDIYNLIRGLSPFPGAITHLDDKLIKILRAKKETAVMSVEPGHFSTDHKTFLKFAAADGFIHITEIQMEGKRKMTIDEFLRGYRVKTK